MPRKERQAKLAAFAVEQELNSEMTDEQRERMLKSGMGVSGGGLDKGEAELFGSHRRRSHTHGHSRIFCSKIFCLLLLAAAYCCLLLPAAACCCLLPLPHMCRQCVLHGSLALRGSPSG